MRLTPAALAALALAGPLAAGGRVYEVGYPPSDAPGGLRFGVTYRLWLPDGVARVRGVVVHQHGCGAGACKGGETAADDLHWQALAAKWDCALLGPSYKQPDGANCRLWCDPRNGSGRAFLRALADLAAKTGRPELERAPWCLWGHSGGGFWASLMQAAHPERVVAVWCRSGTAYPAWEKGEVPKPEIPEAAYRVPVVCNPGAKEKGDKRFNGAWTGAQAMFEAYRARGAPVAFVPDPKSSHDCGGSRYLAIPYFDACLALRLPEAGEALKPVDSAAGWLAEPPAGPASPAAKYAGKPEAASWLPTEAVAKAYAEYAATGLVGDATPPPAPVNVRAAGGEVTWEAAADFESGLGGFVVLRDGAEVARLPEKPAAKYGRALFQGLSYHDTPEEKWPAMRFTDRDAKPGAKHEYAVVAVNGAGLRSGPAGAKP